MINEFSKLTLSAAQLPEEPLDPEFSVPGTDAVMPPADNMIDPDFSVMPPVYPSDPVDPDFSVMPPVNPQDPVDPDFSVMPPVYPSDPVDPDFSVMPPIYPIIPSPTVPCLFCSSNQWIHGGIRLLNAATGYNAFTVLIDGRTVSVGLSFPEITRYRQLSQGYHTFTVMGSNGFILLRRSMYIGDGMSTVAIINAPGGLDLTLIEDTACPTNYNTACFRVCNLAYYSGPVNASIGNVYFNAVNFKTAASFSPFQAGQYTLRVARSTAPETPLVNTPVTLIRRRIYTAYVLNWNPSPDTVQTLLVEDRRN